MSPLSALAPDQRAVLELLLRQGRDYAELSELLGLPETGVRSRAHAALAALAPDRPPPVGEDGAVADWILGQLDDDEAERTSGSIARMPAWHRWAGDVLDRLAEVDGAELPELPQPAEDDAPAAAPKARQEKVAAKEKPKGRARPVRDATAAAGAQHARRRADSAAAAGKSRPAADKSRPAAGKSRPAAPDKRPAPSGEASGSPLRSSRKGGLVLLAGAAIAIAVVLFFVFRGGGDDEPSSASSGATATPTATATPQVVAEIPLKGVGNNSQGLVRVFGREGGGLVFALAVEKIPRNRKNEVYGVWFTKKGGAPRALGFSKTQVGKQQVFTAGGPREGQEAQLAKWLADYDKVVIARAPVGGSKANQLGPVVVSGTLPGGQN